MEWNRISGQKDSLLMPMIDFTGTQYLETKSEASVVSVVSCWIMLYLVDLVTKLVLAFTTDSYRTAPLVMLVRPLRHWGRLWNLSCGALLQRTGSNASLYTLHQGQLPVVSCRSWLWGWQRWGTMRGMCQELGGSKFEWFYIQIWMIL